MDDGKPDRVVLFTRYPVPGDTKTRLIPELGEEGAARLQRSLTEHLLSKFGSLRDRGDLDLRIRFEGGSLKSMRNWIGDEWTCVEQGTGDLGDRMRRTVNRAFLDGRHRVVIVGSDCPGVTCSHVTRALRWLRGCNLVLGPARDGGYYLIGLSEHADELFENIPWGTNEVLDTTLQRAREHGRSYRLLDQLRDVDRPADLDEVPDEVLDEISSVDSSG